MVGNPLRHQIMLFSSGLFAGISSGSRYSSFGDAGSASPSLVGEVSGSNSIIGSRTLRMSRVASFPLQ